MDGPITALYERLSRDDDQGGESNSISNQKKMLMDFAVSHCLPRPVHFTDDGFSGTQFDRPSFTALMKEIAEDHVSAVVVKDLSRLGRDYLKVGQLMEMFRYKSVRFVALIDNVDTMKSEDDFTPFRNIINEWYARDISKKIKSGLRAKGMSGKHLASSCPYGYLRDPLDGDHWMVDPEAAAVIQKIFALAIEGRTAFKIAKLLEKERVEIPAVHMARHGQGLYQNVAIKNPYHWYSSTVESILKRSEYLGLTINFKTDKYFKDKRSHPNPPDSRKIFPNTQEPIIDKETFDRAQSERKLTRESYKGKRNSEPLSGIVYCADCGARMYSHRTGGGNSIVHRYCCSSYSRSHALCPTQHRVSEERIRAAINDSFCNIRDIYLGDKASFRATVRKAMKHSKREDSDRIARQLNNAKRRIGELDVCIAKSYEDYALGRLNYDSYTALSENYASKKKELLKKIKALSGKTANSTPNNSNAAEFENLVAKYRDLKEITNDAIREMVDRVVVHEREEKWKHNCPQKIEVYFKHIGRI